MRAFSWIGSNAFSGTAGELGAFQPGGDWTVEADVNGDGFADLVITVGDRTWRFPALSSIKL